MSQVKVLAVFVALCICSDAYIHVSDVDIYEIFSQKRPLETSGFEYDFSENITRSYVLWPYDAPKSEKVCEIHQEIYNFSSAIVSNRTCKMHLSSGNESVNIDDQYLFVPFGKDKAILLWKVGNFTRTRYHQYDHPTLFKTQEYLEVVLKIGVITFITCEFEEVSVDIDDPISDNGRALKDVNVVTYNDTFEVFFRNKRLCNVRCRATYNSRAMQVTPPSPFLDIDFDLTVDSVSRMNSSGPYIIQYSNDYQARSWLTLVTPESKTLLNHSFVQGGAKSDVFRKLSVSYDHGNLTFCEQSWDKKELVCHQHDSLGNMKLKIGPLKDLGNRLSLIKIMNLPGGGFFLWTGQIFGSFLNDARLLRIMPDGRAVTIKEPGLFLCDDFSVAYGGYGLFQRVGDELCTSFSCSSRDVFPIEDRFKAYNNCFGYQNFTSSLN